MGQNWAHRHRAGAVSSIQEGKGLGGQGVILEMDEPSRWPQHRVCEREKNRRGCGGDEGQL